MRSRRSFIGAFAHMFAWPLSGWNENVYYNPAAECSEKDEDAVFVYTTNGTFDKHGAFSCIVEWLANTPGALPPNVHSIHLVIYQSRYQGEGIDDYAYQLRDYIVANEHKNVILLGHSRGGLVNAFFAEFLAQEAGINVLGVESLTTPFDGSYLARFFSMISESVKQMRPGDDFLECLKDKMRQSCVQYFYHVAGWDWIVKPENCCALEEHRQFITWYSKEGHLSIMRSMKCAKKISAHLWQLCQPFLAKELSADTSQPNDCDDFVIIPNQEDDGEKEADQDFVLMGEPDLPERLDCDIQAHINLLSAQNSEIHQAKILLLYTLREKLFQAIFDTHTLYSEAASVGDFIRDFFESEKAMPVRQTILFPAPSQWEEVVNQLIRGYQDTPFPDKTVQVNNAPAFK